MVFKRNAHLYRKIICPRMNELNLTVFFKLLLLAFEGNNNCLIKLIDKYVLNVVYAVKKKFRYKENLYLTFRHLDSVNQPF